MKLLKRNTKPFEFIPYTGEETDIDSETGLHTGEYVPAYGNPVAYKSGNLSVASRYASQEFFGKETRYTHVLVVNGTDIGIDEYGLIRFNNKVYEIRAVRETLNFTSIALMLQTVDHAETEEE